MGEAFLFAGLTWYFANQYYGANATALVLITATVVGSLTTSYVRARAEGVGETCTVGFFQRTERVILLTVALLLGKWAVVPVLWFLAVATLGTTVQRMFHVAAKLPGPAPVGPLAEITESPEAPESPETPVNQEDPEA